MVTTLGILLPTIGRGGAWAAWEAEFFEGAGAQGGMPAAQALALRAELGKARRMLASHEVRAKPAAFVGELQLQLPEYRALEQRQRLHLEVTAHAEPGHLRRHFAERAPEADENVLLL